MKNITLAIDVNALAREFLADLAGRDERVTEARSQLLRLMDTSSGRMAPDWKFDCSWDSQIVAAAERLGADVLYSEDLNHGQTYGAVRCENPFRSN
jgi:predicted nucleic acid-binding protein